MLTIEVLDVGVGNVDSVGCWLESNGYQVKSIRNPQDSEGRRPLVIPGVCSTVQLATRIVECDFYNVISEKYRSNVKIMGICAGFQVMGRYSDEDGGGACLNICPFHTERLVKADAPYSRVGWEPVDLNLKNTNLRKIVSPNYILRGDAFYNQRYGVTRDDSSMSIYDERYSAIHLSNKFLGLQFHPEKSGVLSKIFSRYFDED